MDSVKSNWEKFGEQDPYYWVTTDSKYKTANLTQEVKKDFFDSADNYFKSIFNVIHKHLDSTFQPERVLDFGCGVGRVAIPLARHFKYVLGIDISESMIKEAEKNKKQYKADNIEFTTNIDRLSYNTEPFDFIYSVYVFQHIKTKEGLQLFASLVDRLKENGIGMFDFLIAQPDMSVKKKIIYWLCIHLPFFNYINNIRKGRSFFTPIYEMNNYPLNKLFEILREKKCIHIYVRYIKEGPYNGVILFFQKQSKEQSDFISLVNVL